MLLIAANVGFADLRFLLRCAKFRLGVGQLILGIGFVFRAGSGRSNGCSYDFFMTIPSDVDRG